MFTSYPLFGKPAASSTAEVRVPFWFLNPYLET